MRFWDSKKSGKIQDNTRIKTDKIVESSSEKTTYHYNCSLLEIWIGWKIPYLGMVLVQKRPHIVIHSPEGRISIYKAHQPDPVQLSLPNAKYNPIDWYSVEFIDSTHEKYLIEKIIKRKQLLNQLDSMRDSRLPQQNQT